MENEDEYKGKITPQKALEMLKEEGMTVTLEEANGILIFLRKLANIAVESYLKNQDSFLKEENVSIVAKDKPNEIVKYCKPCSF